MNQRILKDCDKHLSCSCLVRVKNSLCMEIARPPGLALKFRYMLVDASTKMHDMCADFQDNSGMLQLQRKKRLALSK